MKHKRAFIIAVCVATLLTVSSLAYRRAIVVMYGQRIPEMWDSDFADMNFGEIYQKIGPPQENLSAKGYQNWLIHQWWGWQMLTMDLQDCCPLTAEPTGIYYIVHVNFWYKPAYTKTIRSLYTTKIIHSDSQSYSENHYSGLLSVNPDHIRWA